MEEQYVNELARKLLAELKTTSLTIDLFEDGEIILLYEEWPPILKVKKDNYGHTRRPRGPQSEETKEKIREKLKNKGEPTLLHRIRQSRSHSYNK